MILQTGIIALNWSSILHYRIIRFLKERNSHKTCLTGSSYASLRRPFRTKADRVDYALRNTAKRLFVSFGAIDGKGISPIAVKIAQHCLKDWTIDVVIGADSPSLDQLISIANQDDKITIHANCLAPWLLMGEATLAMGAAGVGALERCAMALPSLIVLTADNQQAAFMALCESGACRPISFSDETTFGKKLESALVELTKNAENRATMALLASDFCDGMGGVRIVQKIEEINAHERPAN